MNPLSENKADLCPECEASQQPDSTSELILGVDYTIENGLLVMTREYHLKRGFCCGNDCRHCPY